MLRLLECYILHAIGELPEADAENLRAMEPQLATIHNASGSWDEIIAAGMEFPPNMPDLVRGMWDKNRKIASDGGENLLPEHFAMMFVDANLA